MAKVLHKSMIPNDKPQWLLNVQQAVEEATGIITLQGDARDWRNLKSFIDGTIEAQRSRGNIQRSTSVKTELRTDDGKTVIHIFRNRMIVQTYYIE